MKPSIGRIVIYNCTEQDIAKQKALYDLGKGCNTQKKLPAVIVAVWNNEGTEPDENTVVNLKVLLDGNSCLWVTSAKQGAEAGQWSEPARV